jgi:plasmid stabilization system protein ParE
MRKPAGHGRRWRRLIGLQESTVFVRRTNEVKYQVRLSDKAYRDIEQILAWFFDQRAMSAGRRWERDFRSRIRKLSRNPHRCPLAPESESLAMPVREVHFGRRPGVYRVFFEIKEREVVILHIRHSARDFVSRDDL